MIVIPMAGRSARFGAEGYRQPKYQLALQSRPVFDYAVSSFSSLFRKERFLFIVQNDDEAVEYVRERVAILGIFDPVIVALERHTHGQAETVKLGLEQTDVGSDEPLAIFNIDTFRPGYHHPIGHGDHAGVVEVFVSEGDNWSFVQPSATVSNGVERIVEKERISDLCCTGLYSFARKGHFDFAYQREREAPSQIIAEYFIAPMYNQLVAAGEKVTWQLIDGQDVISCGVPSDYQRLLAEPGRLRRAEFALQDRS